MPVLSQTGQASQVDHPRPSRPSPPVIPSPHFDDRRASSRAMGKACACRTLSRPRPSRATLPNPWGYGVKEPHRSPPAALPISGYPRPPPEPALPAHDRLEEGVTGPCCHRWPLCAAGAVRDSPSWAILKLMHVSIYAGGDACIDRVNAFRANGHHPCFLVPGSSKDSIALCFR
jgi:hypothetical protein